MVQFRSRGRTGFTLIELLVVIAIIAILIGLLLPAVQKVREAAARMQCSNNLKQLAIAAHSYHDGNGQFPSNGGPGYNFNPTSPNSWSWLAEILPYVEQKNLFTQCGIPTTTINGGGVNVTQSVKTFLCPSDSAANNQPRTDEANIGSTFNYGGPPVPVGQTNYKGVCGSNWGWGTYQVTDSNASWGNDGLDHGNGIFYRTDGLPGTGHGPLKMIQITDGTSNTFMIGEDIPSLDVHCDWPFFNHATGTCAIPLNSGLLAGQPGYGNSTDWPDLYSFRSRHTNGANFAYADGGVSFITNGINQTLYQNLATYSGGEVVTRP